MPDNYPGSQKLNVTIAVSWAPGFQACASAFARENKLPIIDELGAWRGLCFHLNKHGWVIVDAEDTKQGAFVLEFESRYTAQGKDPLLKAMGKAKTVLDMTAGWGGDALHIAESGREVIAVERHPVVHQLLEQARAKLEADLKPRLQFLHLDAADGDFVKNLQQKLNQEPGFDLVYIDPMFQDKASKSAKAKKPMRIMQQLTAAPVEDNEQRLFKNAMDIAVHRVVVKRALKAPYIANQAPQGSIKSKLLRFDLYQPSTHNCVHHHQSLEN